MKQKLIYAALLAAMLVTVAPAAVWDQDRLRDQNHVQTQSKDQTHGQSRESAHDTFYGSQLMTLQERYVYRNRMRSANTQEERVRIRQEHHELMKVRAQAQRCGAVR